MILKIAWANDNCNLADILNAAVIVSIKLVNGFKKSIKIIAPTMLKKTWKKAALLAEILPPIEAITAVIVVPILLPNKNGKAIVRLIALIAYICWIIAIIAADDCTIAVRIIPPSNPSKGFLTK